MGKNQYKACVFTETFGTWRDLKNAVCCCCVNKAFVFAVLLRPVADLLCVAPENASKPKEVPAKSKS